MINLLAFIDRYSIFVFLIICFQYFHSLSLNSFKLEFFIQLIPYLLLLDLFIFPSKLKNFLVRKFLLLSLFISFCFLSLLWTDNFKYTLASNLELLTTSITTIVVAFYIERNEKGIENITKFSLFAIYLLLFLGFFSFDLKRRTFLGISPSLSSTIFNYGSVCSLYLFHKTNKKYHLIPFISLIILNFALSSLRGIFAILIGSIAYLGYYKVKNNLTFYYKVFLSLMTLALIFIFIILRYDFVATYPSYISADNFRFLHQFLINSFSLKITLKDIFINQNFDFTNYEYAGERFSAIYIGIKETLSNSPLIGFGHGNSRPIFESYGKSTYSHNGFIEIFIGTGIIGLFLYLRFLFTQILKPLNKFNTSLIQWKRFSSLIFLVHLFVGLPFENIPLSLMMALIISV